ncbi:hypothetical protein TGDOM2_399480, partial [Toxoplasma gondii GAB2-2007-GAL-DOM2]
PLSSAQTQRPPPYQIPHPQTPLLSPQSRTHLAPFRHLSPAPETPRKSRQERRATASPAPQPLSSAQTQRPPPYQIPHPQTPLFSPQSRTRLAPFGHLWSPAATSRTSPPERRATESPAPQPLSSAQTQLPPPYQIPHPQTAQLP